MHCKKRAGLHWVVNIRGDVFGTTWPHFRLTSASAPLVISLRPLDHLLTHLFMINLFLLLPPFLFT